MFVPLDGPEFPANAFRFRDRLIRYTYRVDAISGIVGGVDIDAKLEDADGEERIYTLRGEWHSKEEALSAAQKWTIRHFDRAQEE
ncbi:hypothetical protein [Pseudomonas sp.]|jgi:hypothetical protein|uniref:hypothetical protein n=1 Tax=Pseudomonas sp. TaxID=306 RepID=UPI0028A8218C|nr:hypothetical protein [Pseudomonas sp.]